MHNIILCIIVTGKILRFSIKRRHTQKQHQSESCFDLVLKQPSCNVTFFTYSFFNRGYLLHNLTENKVFDFWNGKYNLTIIDEIVVPSRNIKSGVSLEDNNFTNTERQ